MKNVHVLPTENYKQDYTLQNGEVVEVVRLGQLVKHNQTNEFLINKSSQWAASCDTDVQVPHHIYITSDEEIKEGDFVTNGKYVSQAINEWWTKFYTGNPELKADYWKIALTTDHELVSNGVQLIDAEFLEQFVKNPNCEEVEIEKENICARCYSNDVDDCWSARECSDGRFDKIRYKIIIPKKEQEASAKALVDDFVKQWREKNNTKEAVYAHYHYDAMIAFAEYYKEISKSK